MLPLGEYALREATLERLAGLQRCFRVEVDGEAFPGTGAGARDRETRPDRTTAVRSLEAQPSAEAFQNVKKGGGRVAVTVRHPAYEARAEPGREALRALTMGLGER